MCEFIAGLAATSNATKLSHGSDRCEWQPNETQAQRQFQQAKLNHPNQDRHRMDGVVVR